MVAAGPRREGGRDCQDLCTGQCEGPVELGEAQVVADGHAHDDAVDLRSDQPVTGCHPR